MVKAKMLKLVFGFLLVFSVNAEAKLFKWVDDQGITHYGEVIPPEYANKNKESLTKSGLIEKQPEKVSPEALRAKEEADLKMKATKQAEIEQQRRDSTLLNTYSNENEIDMARDRSLVLINARVDSNKMLLKSTQSTLDDLKKEAEQRSKSGRKIPQSLQDDMTQTQARIAKYSAEITKSEEDLVAVKARFEKDKELYRRLKGGSTQKK